MAAASWAGQLAPLAARFPGLRVTGRRAVVNAQAELITAQSSYANNLLIGVIAILAAVALVSTLVMATVERRESVRLLARVGAAAGAASVLVVSKALTGTWAPYVTWLSPLAIVSVVLVLTALSVFGPTTWILAAAEDNPGPRRGSGRTRSPGRHRVG